MGSHIDADALQQGEPKVGKRRALLWQNNVAAVFDASSAAGTCSGCTRTYSRTRAAPKTPTGTALGDNSVISNRTN